MYIIIIFLYKKKLIRNEFKSFNLTILAQPTPLPVKVDCLLPPTDAKHFFFFFFNKANHFNNLYIKKNN